MTPSNNFRKVEKLCSHRALEELYKSGEAFLIYPIRCVYRTVDFVDEPLRIMVSVPKRNHKRAVTRNLLKRRIRESYRLNRAIISSLMEGDTAVEFSLTYIAKEVLDYQIIENAVKKTLTELGNRLTATAR